MSEIGIDLSQARRQILGHDQIFPGRMLHHLPVCDTGLQVLHRKRAVTSEDLQFDWFHNTLNPDV